jgi:hypothetical protein
MVGRIHTSRSELVVVFSRDGEADERRLAPNGDRACATALMMLAARGTLQAGDRLLVLGYDSSEPEPPEMSL